MREVRKKKTALAKDKRRARAAAAGDLKMRLAWKPGGKTYEVGWSQFLLMRGGRGERIKPCVVWVKVTRDARAINQCPNNCGDAFLVKPEYRKLLQELHPLKPQVEHREIFFCRCMGSFIE